MIKDNEKFVETMKEFGKYALMQLKQATDWLRRAIDDGIVKKLNKSEDPQASQIHICIISISY
ncbi:hypothetical protein [Clostridium sp. DL1XJH146]